MCFKGLFLIFFFTGTEEVLAKVGAFNVKFEEYDTWLKQAEQTLQDCLPIEANLERLEEQGQLLDVGISLYFDMFILRLGQRF